MIEHAHGDGWFAIIGGYVVRDPSLPSLAGRYVYSDNAVGELYSARLALPRAQDEGPVGIPVPGASSFGEDTAGCVYVAQLGGPVSAWSRTRPASPAPDPPARARFRARRRVRPSA